MVQSHTEQAAPVSSQETAEIAAHTPTPWFLRQAGEVSRNGDPYEWIADSPERGKHRKIIVERNSCFCPGDYAFIVKAVNAHDALTASLKEMIEIYWGTGDGISPPPACIQRAQAALAA